MQLVSLHLQNFRQHTNTTIHFQLGLTGIIGTNGGGKSTILEGIAWVLYGIPAVRGTKDSIKSRRASARDQVRGELVFVLAGHEYRVVRTLSMAELYQDGSASPMANSLSGVSEQLQRVLGMTRTEFFNTYFTGQKELAVMASLGATERGKFLTRVLGYDRIATAQELVRKKKAAIVNTIEGLKSAAQDVDAIAQRVADAAERLAFARASRVRYELLREDANNAFAALVPQWAEVEAKREHSAVVFNRTLLLEEQRKTCERDVSRLSEDLIAIERARDEQAPLLLEVAALPSQRAALVEMDRQAAANTSRQAALSSLAASRELLNRTLGTLDLGDLDEAAVTNSETAAKEAFTAACNASDAHGTARDAWRTEQATANAELTALRAQHASLTERQAKQRALGADGACVACGKPLGDAWQSALATLEVELNTVLAAGAAAKERVAALKEVPASVSALERVRDEAAKSSKAAEEILDRRKQRHTAALRVSEDIANLKTRIAAQEAQLPAEAANYDGAAHTALRADVTRLAQIETRVAVLGTQVQRLASVTAAADAAVVKAGSVASELGAAQDQYKAIGFDEDTYNTTRTAHRDADVRAREMELAVLSAVSEVTRAEEAQGFALQQQHEAAATREKLTMLDLQRREHEDLDRAYGSLRTDLNAKLRPELAEIASGLLDTLTDGRYTQADFDENYTLTVMEDGTAKPVISGGEEDLCNLILRLAISQMIAQRAGHAFSLLILDEVFGSLDETRRNNVVELLRGIGDRFEQVIVITHTEQVREGLDHILVVQYDEESGSSRVMVEGAATPTTEVVAMAEAA